mgnify:CR=1 FL=1
MRFYRAQPEKRRYAALLVPESSSLIGADDWKAEQLREQCEEAGWIFQCNSIYWQIFYTTDDAAKRRGDMEKERQFQIQKALSWNWSVKIFLSYLGCIRNMGCVSVSAKSRETVCRSHAASFDSAADRYDHFLGSDVYTAVSLESWKIWRPLKERESLLREQDLKRTLKCKKYTFMGDGILILGVIALAFLSSMEALISFILSSTSLY